MAQKRHRIDQIISKLRRANVEVVKSFGLSIRTHRLLVSTSYYLFIISNSVKLKPLNFFAIGFRGLQNTAELLNPDSLTQTGTKRGTWSGDRVPSGIVRSSFKPSSRSAVGTEKRVTASMWSRVPGTARDVAKSQSSLTVADQSGQS